MKTENRGKLGLFGLIFAALFTAWILVNSAAAGEDTAAKILYFTGLNSTSVITLSNSENAEDIAIITAYNASGHPVDTEAVTIAAGKTEDFEIGNRPADTRSVTVEFKGTISGSALVSGQTLSAVEKPMSQFKFPAENISSVVILNPNDIQTDVTLIALDDEGIEIERSTVSGLYPMESREVVVKEAFGAETLSWLSSVKLESKNVIISHYTEVNSKSLRKSYKSSSSCQQNAVGGQCVRYAREWAKDYWGTTDSMVPYLGTNGSAYQIYDKWNLKGGKGSVPANNSLIILDKGSGIPDGHVGVVLNSRRNSDGIYTLTVNESNWDLDEKIDCNVTYTYKNQSGGIVTKRGSSAKWLKLRGFVYSKANSSATGSLSGKLHENTANGPALSGAAVTCGGKSTKTSSSGSFSLSGISTGWQNLKFSKTWYQSYEKGIYITAGKNASAGDVYLKNQDRGKDQAAFVSENYPDNTSVAGGTSFIKEWKIKNTGTTTWNSAYKLRLYKFSGARLSTVSEVAVSGTVTSNSVYTFRVPMKAPNAQTVDKTYREDWSFVGPSGIIPVSGSQTVWVKIKVPANPLPPPQPTTGGVYGTLHENSADGSRLSGASVSIAGKSAVTDGNGLYRLSELSTGWQTLSFSKDGYQPYQKGVYITAGQNADAGDSYLVKNASHQPKPSISIKNPSSGEEWRSDERKHIEWTYENFPSRGDVSIYYKIDKDDSKWRTIESSTTNDGGRYWEMCDFKTEDSKDAQIKIQSIQYPEAFDIVTFKMDHAKECE
ncbi:MAG: carboxypeptidase regulatory-like domain-containing protein [Desulfococcaceae bacterium]